jgi:hypothetical protein
MLKMSKGYSCLMKKENIRGGNLVIGPFKINGSEHQHFWAGMGPEF